MRLLSRAAFPQSHVPAYELLGKPKVKKSNLKYIFLLLPLIFTVTLFTFYPSTRARAYYARVKYLGGQIPKPCSSENDPSWVCGRKELRLGHRPFKILFWTPWYGYRADSSSEFVKPECKNEFIVTSNKSEYGSADVIAFQFVDFPKIADNISFQFPPTRDINVPWILASQESSIQHPLYLRIALDGIFNWTWSLRSDSLIHPNFTEMFDKFQKPDTRWLYGSQFSMEFLRNKTLLSAWVVSNCVVIQSERIELAFRLIRLGIQIDQYGDCGPYTCPNGEECFATLGKTYKFYFALENSLCEDYITEKIYHGLLHGMVPVVYALGNVEMNAPPNSYINVLDFPTLSDLAKRLKYLDRNPREYFKYFEWRQHYNVNVTGSPRYQCYTWRKMKEFTMKLGTDEDSKYRHTYENLTDWHSNFYNRKLGKRCEVCLSPEVINVTRLSVNKQIMYNDSSRCM